MKRAGQIALTPFPNTDLSGSKRRPVLLIRQASIRFDDWLVCMVSSQLHQAETGFDDTLELVDKLKTAGFAPEQAEAVVRAIGTAQDEHVTKANLEQALAPIRTDLTYMVRPAMQEPLDCSAEGNVAAIYPAS
ncbi:hypothetical protein [Lamprobacter modestohalophilus]|uniref:hypothetical protein n=1 Tax=Lamprobacter modestohalophilus TaxID=1064514 RepID=UPI0019065931|nr:hypothetical protein [Lamprobacter modestohalophilus]